MTADGLDRGVDLSPIARAAFVRPEDTIDEVLRALSSAFDGHLAAFQTFGPIEVDEIPITSFRAYGDLGVIDRARRFFERSPQRRPVRILHRAGQKPRFEGMRAMSSAYGGERALERIWAPIRAATGAIGQERTLVFDGPRLVGWLGILNLDSAEADRRLVARANALLPSLTARLVVAYRAVLAANPDVPGDLVVDSRGRVEYASAEGRSWLDRPGFEEALASIVSRPSDITSEVGEAFLVGASARVVRLESGSATRYLVQMSPVDPPSVSTVTQLTPAQHRVAVHAASGATVSQIAKAVGCADHTVRVHLRTIYERLGVSNRIELARELEK